MCIECVKAKSADPDGHGAFCFRCPAYNSHMEESDSRIDQPTTLFKQAAEIRNKYGSKEFLNGDNEECHKGREAFFAFFFLIGFRKLSRKDWWIYQPERFPDLQLVSFQEQPPFIDDALQYELVTIPGHYTDVESMVKNVTNKIGEKHYALNGKPCGLLVFSNNENSRDFELTLYSTLDKISPFTEVWTTSLESPDKVNVSKIIVSKVRPHPVIRFEFDANDQSLYTYQKPPACMEVVEQKGMKFLRIKHGAMNEVRKEAIKRRLRHG